MNKNLLVSVLAAGLLLVGCAPKDPIALAGKTMHVVGANALKVDGQWVDNKWEPTAENEMKAISLADVKALDKDLYKNLKDKEITGLYYGEVGFGVKEVGWTKDAMKDGEKITVDGSYTIKCIRAVYEEEDKTYLNDQWISDPKTAHAEALTDNLFIATWQEEADENGFSWSSDPICLGEAGTYGVVLAQYKDASAPTVPGFGIGLVLLEAAA